MGAIGVSSGTDVSWSHPSLDCRALAINRRSDRQCRRHLQSEAAIACQWTDRAGQPHGGIRKLKVLSVRCAAGMQVELQRHSAATYKNSPVRADTANR